MRLEVLHHINHLSLAIMSGNKSWTKGGPQSVLERVEEKIIVTAGVS